MKKIIATCAALTALSLTGCGAISEHQDRRQLEKAWDQTSVDDKANMCAGFEIFPNLTREIAEEAFADSDIDGETAADFIEEKCS